MATPPSPMPSPAYNASLYNTSLYKLLGRLAMAVGFGSDAIIGSLSLIFVLYCLYRYRNKVPEASAAMEIAYRDLERDEEEGNGGDCAICLDEFEEEDVCLFIEKCRHFFHRRCVDPWFRTKRRCPLCRCFVRVEFDESPLK